MKISEKIMSNEPKGRKKIMIIFGAIAAVCAAVVSYPVPVLVPVLVYFKLGGAIATAISGMQLLSSTNDNKEANQKGKNK